MVTVLIEDLLSHRRSPYNPFSQTRQSSPTPRWSPPQSILNQLQYVTSVAPNLPQDYVQKILLARLRIRLDEKEIDGLRSFLSVFPDGAEFLQNPKHEKLLTLILAYLPFGFSKDEAVFLVQKAGCMAIGTAMNVGASATPGYELNGWAKSRLGPKMPALKKALADQYFYANDDWFMSEEFINCRMSTNV